MPISNKIPVKSPATNATATLKKSCSLGSSKNFLQNQKPRTAQFVRMKKTFIILLMFISKMTSKNLIRAKYIFVLNDKTDAGNYCLKTSNLYASYRQFLSNRKAFA
jgi:hypothetical protein